MFLYDFSTGYVGNSIFWENEAWPGPRIGIGVQSKLHLRYTDRQGGQAALYIPWDCTRFWETGMINVNPRFQDSPAGDFRLAHGSPCIDLGADEFCAFKRATFLPK